MTDVFPGVPQDGDQPCTLDDAHKTFARWLGDDYDRDALNTVLAAAAVERLGGDPLWLLVISGPGNAKTETVQSLRGTGATLTSTISSEGALLSATPRKERSKDATGGLLPKLGAGGVLVIKDVTSIISMSRDRRAEGLAALREVYDGHWYREVGVDGGRTLEWTGRIVVVGAVTTAWDRAHDVTSAMGDRFVLVRMDSADKATRRAAGRQAIGNTNQEEQMRAELSGATGGVIAQLDTKPQPVTDDEIEALLAAADLVTLARTGVDFDYQGKVIDAHAPEMPTRFAKQLTQIVYGGVAIGLTRREALHLAIRCARDSMPPLRLAIIDDLAEYSHSSPTDVRKRLKKPWTTVDRQMQALHMLGVVDVTEEEEIGVAGKPVTRWYYSLAEGIQPEALKVLPSPEMATPPPRPQEERDENGEEDGSLRRGVAKSGDGKERVSNGSEPSTPTDISGMDQPPDEPGTSGQNVPWHTCRTEGCTAGLWHPESQQLGYCAKCRKDDAA